MIEWILLSLILIGPAIYWYGCRMEKKQQQQDNSFEEQSAYYHIPGLPESDIHEDELWNLR